MTLNKTTAILDMLVRAGYAERKGDRYRITPKGRLATRADIERLEKQADHA